MIATVENILLVIQDFPGRGTRNYKVAKYLSDGGFRVHVLTNCHKQDDSEKALVENFRSDNHEIHYAIGFRRSPFRILSRVLGWRRLALFFEKIFFFPDIYITWVPFAFFKSRRLIKKHGIKKVITFSPAESVHVTGLLLKKVMGKKIFWAANFEDLWTTKKIVYSPPTKLHHWLTRKLEIQVYERCDVLIANTAGNADLYRMQFHVPDEKIQIVTLGYDSEDMKIKSQTGSLPDRFRIGYMGYFDKSGFPWQVFVEAVKNLVSSGLDQIEVEIYGPASTVSKDMVKELGLDDLITFKGTFSHETAFSNVRTAHLLLLLLYETQYSDTIVPQKLYHYLVMRRPILAISGETGEVARILNETGAGCAISASKPETIIAKLEQYYNSWEKYNCLEYGADPEKLEKYDIRKITTRFAGILREAPHRDVKDG